jgi:D-alanyl-D-alanine carboxypeptidase
MKHALTYPLIKEILGTKACLIRTTEGRDIFVENSDDLLWRNDNMIGGKTGYTGNARHCFVGAINTEKGAFFTAVLGARSRSSLWRSTLMLAELGMHPELAYLLEKPRRARRASPAPAPGPFIKIEDPTAPASAYPTLFERMKKYWMRE